MKTHKSGTGSVGYYARRGGAAVAGAICAGLLVLPAAVAGAPGWAMAAGCGAAFLAFDAMVCFEAAAVARRERKRRREEWRW